MRFSSGGWQRVAAVWLPLALTASPSPTYASLPPAGELAAPLEAEPFVQSTWSGWRELERFNPGATVPQQRRIYGLGLDEMVRLEADIDESGDLETQYLPVYDQTGSLVALLNAQGKPVVRYGYSPFGEISTVEADLEGPRSLQLLIRGQEFWLTLNESISREALERALSNAEIRLEATPPGRARQVQAKQAVPLAVRASNDEDLKQGTRWIFTPTTPIEVGSSVELIIASGALEDNLLNHAAEDQTYSAVWPAQAVVQVVADATAPEIERIDIVGGRPRILFSEEVSLGAIEAAVRVNGETITWAAAGSGFEVLGNVTLATGQHTIELRADALDLAGKGLAELQSFLFTLNTSGADLLVFLSSRHQEISGDLVNLYTGFHGHGLDIETGLMYLRNRYYDPELGRFISADPLGFVDGPNVYAFAGNDPLNNSDPMGLCIGAWAKNTEFCQSVARGAYKALAFVKGDPEAEAAQALQIQKWRHGFRQLEGYWPTKEHVIARVEPDNFLSSYWDGTGQFHDTSGRVEGTDPLLMLTGLGYGARKAFVSVLAGGGSRTAALEAALLSAADDAAGEVIGLNPNLVGGGAKRVYRVFTPGQAQFQLRKGENGLWVFDASRVTPDDIFPAFREGSEVATRTVKEIEDLVLVLRCTPGDPCLPKILQDAHMEISPGPGMTRNQFKSKIKDLEPKSE